MQSIPVKPLEEDLGKRLDVFMAEFALRHRLGLSRTTVKALIVNGHVWHKDLRPLTAHYKVKAGDEFIICPEEKAKGVLAAEDIPLDIVYEDEDLAILNKQVGLVVHPAPGNSKHTLVNALLFHLKNLSDINPLRPGIVHRLDKDTSGLMVVAKNNPAHLDLARQFAEHSIKRTYVALVKGRVEFDAHTIEMPIGRHPYKRKNMAVGFGKNTKFAKTSYHTLKRGKSFSLLELTPFTGRTHQLRVHLAFLGNPILGDPKYGKNNDFSRLALHASSLGFIHPRTKKPMHFNCGLPQEFQEFLEAQK